MRQHECLNITGHWVGVVAFQASHGSFTLTCSYDDALDPNSKADSSDGGVTLRPMSSSACRKPRQSNGPNVAKRLSLMSRICSPQVRTTALELYASIPFIFAVACIWALDSEEDEQHIW
eukprot:5533350-Amphidinium_carterae.1